MMRDFIVVGSLFAGIAYATPPQYPSEYKTKTYVM